MRVEQANFKMIESELYSYKDTLQYIADKEDEILNSTGGGSEIRGTDISDITGSKALRLISHKELAECRRRVRAIDASIEILKQGSESKKYELVKLKYFDKRLTDYGIIKELYISRRTFYRWRREIIELIAYQLGCRV